MNGKNDYPELFRRYRSNPILTAAQWPYPVHVVFNPAATKLADGTTLLLCRCEDRRGISHFTAARSENGMDHWVIDHHPTMEPDPAHPEEAWGIEDARITWIEEIGQFAVIYTAYSEAGPGVALALTKDFVEFERWGMIMSPVDKDAALFPRKIGGEYRLIHRPVLGDRAHIWISSSPDLQHWGAPKLVLPARRGSWWDANRIGLSPPPIETSEGWLVVYHGAQAKVNGSVYRLGLALLDLEHPETCILRSENWVMGPETRYEQMGDVPYVVFPCGWTMGKDTDALNIYYGAADSCIAIAEANISELLAYLREDGKPPDSEPWVV